MHHVLEENGLGIMEQPKSEERVLSLDISTKTGYCLAIVSSDGMILEDYGQLPKISCPDEESYPGSYVGWAYLCYGEIERLIEQYRPDVLVIEETTRSKNSFSQKILEFLHFLVARFIRETGIKNVYYQTGEWRKEVGSHMNLEEKQRNKEVREYKKKNKTKIAYDINGKRIGMIGKKHVTIRLVNETFKDQLKQPLKRKDEDTADAVSLNFCYYLRKKRGLSK
jgi:Holliday junction resolvasome RuvABC endonuclease subunit